MKITYSSAAGVAAGATSMFNASATSTASSGASTGSSISTTPSFTNQAIQALKESSISNTSSVAVQSALNGESFEDSMKSQWKNILIGAVANLGAKEIGNAAHGSIDANGNYISPQIDKANQLILHAGLGAATARLGGNDALSGAVSGVVGELTAETATNAGLDRNQAIQVSGVAGGASAILTGNLTGQDDDKIANNIWSGSRIASNAAANNALQVKAQKVAGTKNHLTVVHTPEADEQALYANKDGYVQDKESGLWIRTWGAGPESFSKSIFGALVGENLTDLLSKPNRDRDADLSIKNYTSPNLVPPSQEGRYVQLLNDLDLNYQDNLKYDLFPTLNSPSGYNSNSYVSGLLIAADIVPPSIPDKKINYQWQGWEYSNTSPINVEYRFPFQVPGYDKPVPSQYFKSN